MIRYTVKSLFGSKSGRYGGKQMATWFSWIPPATCRKSCHHSGFTYGEICPEYYPKGQEFIQPKVLNCSSSPTGSARQGDVILHASSFLYSGKGYAFVGHSGAGKSTLVRNIACRYPVVVLGEDHVILRRKDTGFWVFGTPWHEDPAMCSPLGAPIDKLFFLDRSQARGVKQLGALEGVTRLMQTARIPYYQPDLVAAHPGPVQAAGGKSDILHFILSAWQ